MKMSPELQKAQENMQPGVITSDGFLGDDHRPLIEMIQDDEEHMAHLGIDWDVAAAKLRELMDEGRKGLGEPVTVQNTWIVRTDEARGFLASPFEDGIFRKVNAELELAPGGTSSGDKLLYTELSLHLMEKHHFLEGRGSSFRIEPSQLKKVLQM